VRLDTCGSSTFSVSSAWSLRDCPRLCDPAGLSPPTLRMLGVETS
jgi:hypothetical protein